MQLCDGSSDDGAPFTSFLPVRSGAPPTAYMRSLTSGTVLVFTFPGVSEELI
ncbi:hypothetical protein PISMIDRAFT_674075 [Pisolithus microcarpus 441]|uniref:Uncharacterized protein n=1 Tax=Pisolithus microcarpus 441 TaxID=765257 RepID=A0A0C9YTQ9_9AGAM|nr:hypothetical protein PISMIDRAFT_674075 [Pisolithus microcarpus 441]